MRRPAREALLLGATLIALASGARAAQPDLFGGGRLVAYLPRGWDPRTGVAPGPASLRADADELVRRGFRAVVTPSVRALAPVCRRFKRRGIRVVLIEVPDPRDDRQRRTAVHARRCADGYVVGDGGLAAGRYARADLATALARLRRRTGKPVAIREALRSYDDDPELVALGDWVFPLADPSRAGQDQPQPACGWSIERFLDFSKRRIGVPVVLADTAFATDEPAAMRESYQRAFYLCIETRAVRFAYAEAFDQPWRDPAGGPDAHRGLFRADGTPKLLAGQLAAPALTFERAGAWLRGRVRRVAPERFRVVVYACDGRWEPVAGSGVSRRGKWKVRAAAAAGARAVLMPRSAVPGVGLERPPQVDGVAVFAIADER